MQYEEDGEFYDEDEMEDPSFVWSRIKNKRTEKKIEEAREGLNRTARDGTEPDRTGQDRARQSRTGKKTTERINFLSSIEFKKYITINAFSNDLTIFDNSISILKDFKNWKLNISDWKLKFIKDLK